MSSLDEIVEVIINVQAPTITRAGFGTPMIVGYHTAFPERVRTYSTATEMVEDGFPAGHPMVRLATAIKSQSPAVPRFKVGRRALAPTQRFRFPIQDTREGVVYLIGVISPGGIVTEVRHVNGPTETPTTIIQALLPQFNAIAGLTATRPPGPPPEDEIVCEADVAGELFDYVSRQGFEPPESEVADPGIATDLAAIRDADSDWYGLLLDSNSKQEVLPAAAWADGQRVLFGAASSDGGVLNPNSTDDVAYRLRQASRSRTFLAWNEQVLSPIAAAWMSRMLTTTPGTSNWSYKTLPGVSPDNLTTSQRAAVDAKNANHYTTVAGRNVTRYGVLPSGQFIDVTRFVDFLSARLQENIFGLLVSRPKVPYTDGGVDLITNEIRAQLRRGVESGALAANPEPTVTAPRVADVPSVDRANRVLPDVQFTAQLAGAINKVRIKGTLIV